MIDKMFFSLNGRKYHIRRGQTENISLVTELIKRSFAIWLEYGVAFPQLKRTDDYTASYHPKTGYEIVDAGGEIVGVFALEECRSYCKGDSLMICCAGKDPMEYLPRTDLTSIPMVKRAAFLSRMAVSPDFLGTGLGTALVTELHSHLLMEGVEKLFLDTAETFADKQEPTLKAVSWNRLLRWYMKLGFVRVGQQGDAAADRPEQFHTVLLVK